MTRIKNIHPGEVLQEEFLVPLEITAYRLSKDIDIPQTRISEIIKGNRRVTADTALRLSRYFSNPAKFWLGLQYDYDIEEEQRLKSEDINLIIPAKIKAVWNLPELNRICLQNKLACLKKINLHRNDT